MNVYYSVHVRPAATTATTTSRVCTLYNNNENKTSNYVHERSFRRVAIVSFPSCFAMLRRRYTIYISFSAPHQLCLRCISSLEIVFEIDFEYRKKPSKIKIRKNSKSVFAVQVTYGKLKNPVTQKIE